MAKRRTNERVVPDAAHESRVVHEPAHAEIRERAYYRYVDRGRVDGFHLEDWYLAEAELRAQPPLGGRNARSGVPDLTPPTDQSGFGRRPPVEGASTARTSSGRRRARV
jgi:hypothetical protein